MGAWLLLDPQVLRWFEVVSENRDDFLDLFITVSVHKEVDVGSLLATTAGHIELNLKLSFPREILREPGVFILGVIGVHFVGQKLVLLFDHLAGEGHLREERLSCSRWSHNGDLSTQVVCEGTKVVCQPVVHQCRLLHERKASFLFRRLVRINLAKNDLFVGFRREPSAGPSCKLVSCDQKILDF